MRIALVLLLFSGGVYAQSGGLEKMQEELDKANKRIEALEKEQEKAKLEAELRKELESTPPPSGGSSSGGLASIPLGGGAQAKLLDLSIDLLMAAGTSTAQNDEIQKLQAGGHDPHIRGFTIQNLELTATGAVDPYFTGEVHLVYFIDRDGASQFELEEGFFTTTGLPLGLQVRGGQMFEQFGRINPQHPHSWNFVDQPVVLSRFMGEDGLRSQGVEVSWLAPTPWYLILLGGVYNATGGTEYSFVNVDEPPFPGEIGGQRTRSLKDMQYLGRIASNFDLGDTIASTVGGSWVHGPNSTGPSADTDIWGLDFYLRWKPLETDQGWPFLQFQAEWMGRQFERGSGFDGTTVFEHKTYWDWGWYAQVVWGFTPHWTAGVRFDNAHGQLSAEDPDDARHDPRYRVSAQVTFYPSEFSKIRLQYNYDHASHIDSAHDSQNDEHSIWLQFEFLLGKHGAHKF